MKAIVLMFSVAAAMLSVCSPAAAQLNTAIRDDESQAQYELARAQSLRAKPSYREARTPLVVQGNRQTGCNINIGPRESTSNRLGRSNSVTIVERTPICVVR